MITVFISIGYPKKLGFKAYFDAPTAERTTNMEANQQSDEDNAPSNIESA